MPAALDEIIDLFSSVEPQMRLELLLDYSKKLPALPEHYQKLMEAGAGRIHECMTPVFLWVDRDDEGRVHPHIGVAEEAPTIAGIAGILVKALDGCTQAEIAAVPNDLVEKLGLHQVLRMNRSVGVAALVTRLKHQAAA